MEFQRRIGHGRLSEIFGAATVAAGSLPAHGRLRPRRARRLGAAARRCAQRRSTPTSPASMRSSRRITAAAAAGVHAAPLRARAVDRARRPRLGEDDGVGSERELLVRAAAPRPRCARVGPERMPQLMPPYPRGRPEHPRRDTAVGQSHAAGERTSETPNDSPRNSAPRTAQSLVERASPAALSAATPRFAACCSAARRPKRSARTTGSSTARSPPAASRCSPTTRISARSCPRLWYLAHLSAGDFDVIGATLPGTPAVAIGRNRFIAWGATNVAADVEDLYRERLDRDRDASPSSAARRSR